MRRPLLLKVSSSRSVEDTAIALQAAVQAHAFSVVQVHNLKEMLAQKGVELPSACLIFEVSQPRQALAMLVADLSISTALPLRISIYEKAGKTVMATLKPSTLLARFKVKQLDPVALEIETCLMTIMKEAAG